MNYNKKIVIKLLSTFLMMLIIIIFQLTNILNIEVLNLKLTILIFSIIIIFALLFHYFKSTKFRKILSFILDYFSIFIYAFFFIQILFNFFIFPAGVKQSSMNPTLFEGNRLIVFNGNKDLDRFDIVVMKIDVKKQSNIDFKHDGELWVKRVIGLPEEHLKYQNGKLYINNEEVYEPYLYDENGNFHHGSYLDADGKQVNYNSLTHDFSIEDILKITKNLTVNEINEGVIPKDYYLLLGDNRDNSYDSRRIGLVHKSQIVGECRYFINNVFNWKKIGD